MKRFLLLFASFAFLSLASLSADEHKHEHAAGDSMAPASVIHVVTVSWKEDATEEQIQAALDGVKTLAKDFDGITRVWIKTLKAQGDRTHAFVMEFKDAQALEDYSGSDAQKAWYELYLPVRGRSTTFDISN